MDRLAAYSYEYGRAQLWRLTRMIATLGFAAASPIVLIWFPGLVDYLAAAAGLWLVVGNTLIASLERSRRTCGARFQELYDTELFGLRWNAAMAGRRPPPDDVMDSAFKVKDRSRYHDWYNVDVTGLPWPSDVLLCQRQSAVWARRDHRAYAVFLAVSGASWFVFGLGLAIMRQMTLADYLLRLGLPSAPAYLASTELMLAHWRHAVARQQLEDEIDDLWSARATDAAVPTSEDCRRIQDGAFQARRTGPTVPDWFYKLRRDRMTRATVAGARSLRGGAKPPI